MLCWFHLRQSGYRRLSAMKLAPLLDSVDEYVGGIVGGAPVEYTFKIWVRIVYALAYVPKESVLAVYDEIAWPDIVHAFLEQYFEGIYIDLKTNNTFLFHYVQRLISVPESAHVAG
jgi:hypothetical protein